jgi:hypothetical protein
MNDKTTVLVSGYAQAPKGTGMSEVMKWMGVVLEIDCRTNQIVQADGTFITELARDFFRRHVVGFTMTDGLDKLVKIVDTHMQTPSKNALIVAVQAAFQRYVEVRQSGQCAAIFENKP